jgi:hypothetical protein
MRGRRTIVLLILCILTATPIQGQVLPGRWEKVEGLQPGTAIIVTLKTGERLEGVFKSVNQVAVDVTEEGPREREIPKSFVQSIETAGKVPDRLRNGTLIGLLIGAACGIASMVTFINGKTNGPVYWDGDGAGYLIGAALAGGGIGAATGAIVDVSIKRHEVLYQARQKAGDAVLTGEAK